MPEEKTASSKPKSIFPSADQLPAELLPLSWCCFRFKWDGHRWKKPPYSTRDDSKIGATAEYETDFRPFADAVVGAARHKHDGVGLVFRDQGYVGIDFDDCRDPNTGEIHPEVVNWLRWFSATYAEVSVSGTGVHVICKGKIPRTTTPTPLPNAKGITIEIYSNNRYFTATGLLLKEHQLQVSDCQVSVDKLRAHVDKKTASGSASDAKNKKQNMSPLSRMLVQKLYLNYLDDLLRAPEGTGNSKLNDTAFFAARAYRSGALGETTEEKIKAQLLQIVTREWKNPHDEHGARGTIDSGWSGGLEAEPLNVSNTTAIRFLPGDLETALHASESVLHAMGLKYFERNRELVHTIYGRDAKEKGYERAAESVIIAVASHSTLIGDLDKLSQFFVPGESDVPRILHVPASVPGHLHNRVETKPREVPFPTLDMVTASPVLLPSGRISQEQYEEGVLFVPRDRSLYPSVPDHPTREDALVLLQQFDEVFGEFPFVDPNNEGLPSQKTASYSVALCIPLSLVARPKLGLGAYIPLITVNAPTPRYGKTKIIKAGVVAALGYQPTTVHFVDEEEFGKHLLPLMRAGDRAILIDNVERTLQSTKLNILITENVLRDRILGESKDVVLKNFAVFFATGNNLIIGGDLTTRALRCDIDAKLERPEERNFSFDPVERAQERHPRLVVAACTALRAYILAGMPWELKRAPWGGFKEWDRLVSGCLVWLGYADPYETRDRIIGADPVRSANADILQEWHKVYGEQPVSLRMIKKDKGEVYEALLEKNLWNGHYAQWILRRLENKVLDGYRLVRLKGQSQFCVQKLKGRQEELGFSASGSAPQDKRNF